MTPEEAKANLGKTIIVKKKGMIKGYGYEKIIEFNPDERTIWGKGTVRTESMDIAWRNIRRNRFTKCALSQINLYQGETKQRKRKNRNSEVENNPVNKRKRKSNGVDSETTNKRKRNTQPSIEAKKRTRNSKKSNKRKRNK